ncbi:MAG: methionine biosynthesis protein MetW [Candidatus Margulisiibacteriota bacterium]|jgi:methionine biosynthesis protein MetW
MQELYLKKIIENIDYNSKILDLGCGDGTLIELLKKFKDIKGYGVEINKQNLLACLKKGISVVQGDINCGLPEYQDQSFDYIILSQTLQEIEKPLLIIKEMLRVGRKVIITFPNFSYWQIRLQLLLGHIPRTSTLPFEWFETPNIRFININNFKQLCKKEKITIIKEIPLFKIEIPIVSKMWSNLFAEKALFIITGF